jgi:hypothetical protein
MMASSAIALSAAALAAGPGGTIGARPGGAVLPATLTALVRVLIPDIARKFAAYIDRPIFFHFWETFPFKDICPLLFIKCYRAACHSK